MSFRQGATHKVQKSESIELLLLVSGFFLPKKSSMSPALPFKLNSAVPNFSFAFDPIIHILVVPCHGLFNSWSRTWGEWGNLPKNDTWRRHREKNSFRIFWTAMRSLAHNGQSKIWSVYVKEWNSHSQLMSSKVDKSGRERGREFKND